MVIKDTLSKEGKSIAEFGRDIGVNRVTAMRIVNGERFLNIRGLFAKIYDATGITPNDILDIHPQQKRFKK